MSVLTQMVSLHVMLCKKLTETLWLIGINATTSTESTEPATSITVRTDGKFISNMWSLIIFYICKLLLFFHIDNL